MTNKISHHSEKICDDARDALAEGDMK